MPYATYRFNKIIAAETIRFIVTVAIVVYKGLKLVVYRMLTFIEHSPYPLFGYSMLQSGMVFCNGTPLKSQSATAMVITVSSVNVVPLVNKAMLVDLQL